MAELRENLARLQAACDNPRAQLDYYLKQGKKAVGCFAPYAPEELVHASGMIPMGLWGGQTEFQKVTSYLPAFACPIMQANLEFALNGVYEGLSAVIIPAICDTLRCMTQNWRFGVPSIPMVPIVYPQNRTSPASVDYLISEYETVLTILSTVTGQMMNEKALCRTIEIYNEHNAAMREFAQVANDHLDMITPRVRHTVFNSSFFFEKEEHTAIVKEITAALREQPVHDWTGKKIILTGIAFEPDEVLDILAENQLAVVGDDLAPASYQAVATYSGKSYHRVATGYITSANYVGEVSRNDVESVTYKVTYLGSESESSGLVIDRNGINAAGLPGKVLPYVLGVLGVGTVATLAVLLFRSRRALRQLQEEEPEEENEQEEEAK